jgi:uncharacterized protein (TIGR02145 family)
MNHPFYIHLKSMLLTLILIISVNQLIAQTGNGIFFQAVARDNFSNPAKDRKIYVQSTIIQTTATGVKVLTEEHQATTDATGVFNISIGNGTRVGGTASSLANIDWSNGPFFLNLKVAITPVGGTSSWDYTKEWVDMGTTNFGAVPYAYYAANVAGFNTKLNVSDSTKYVTPTQLAAKTFDQTPIINALATKLNIADSSKYVTPIQLAAKTFDQTPIINAIATKLNIADSTNAYVTPTQLAAKTFDTVSLSNRINSKANTDAPKFTGSVAIGTSNPASAAALDITSTTQGLLLPRLTYAQKMAIVSPVAGLVFWCTDCGVNGEMQVYNGTAFVNMIGNTAQFALPSINATTGASSITASTALSGGVITSDGGEAITARGIVWGATTAPTIALATKTTDGIGTGTFTSSLTGLTSGFTYYVRAYATNNVGTQYGTEISFSTSPAAPTLAATTTASSIGATTVESGGNITYNGGATVILSGLVWSTTSTPTIALATKTTNGPASGTFTSSITGLTPGTLYYVRSYATNSVGTNYGAQTSFTTLNTATISATASATLITSNSATTGGDITADGGAAVTSRGVVYGTSAGSATYSVTSGTGTGTYTISLTGLTPATTYFVRSFATNSVGTVYGTETSFTTIALAPSITSSTVTGTTKYGASVGGTITSNGGSIISVSGICWSTTATPTTSDSKTTDGTTSGTFTSTITGLTAGTTYFVRAYATNAIGTSYGAVESFTTLSTPLAQTTVLIGTQRWTDKNLNVANYRNGDPITYAANAAQWAAANAAGEGAYTYLKYASGDGGATYGKLYNWYAVNDARGLAPTGYHVPTKAEWTTLRGTQPGNGKTLKSNTNDWSASFNNVNNFITYIPDANYSNYNGTNSTGFNALPGGSLFPNGTNGNYGSASLWTATIDPLNSAKANWTYFHSTFLYDGADCCGTYELGNGMAIRLVKDNNAIETSPINPILANTTAATSITANSAILGGTITDEGATQVSVRGLVYGTTTGSSTYSVTVGSGGGTFTSTLTGLSQGTTYYVRSFATNTQGTAYGTETSFTTQTTPTVSVTATPTSLTTTSAVGGGTISTTGGATITTSGLVWDANANPTIALATKTTDGTTSGTFTSSITGLTQGATYHVRAYATNYLGTSYGPDITFTTITTPTISATATITSITGTTATGGGTISLDGGSNVTSRGLVWGTTTGSSTYSVTSGTGAGTYTASITGLSIATTYFVRSFATNIAGTVYGPEVQFATPSTATVASTITSTITSSTAILGGVLTSNGGATTTIGIMYSTASNFGTFSITSINVNAVAGTYTTTISGLSPVTNYYAKAYATNTAGTTYGPTISFTTPVAPIAINDIYGGGIVYYILQPGDNGYDANVQHGLIAQQTNEPHNSGITTWDQIALNSNTISGAQNDGTLVGKANTAAIIANQGNGTYLFKYVSTLTINGYSDWYVPSIREVNLFRNYVYNTTYCISNGPFPYYWISKANSSYKWAWGSYVSSTQSGSSYYANYIENNGVHTKAYNQRQSGDNYVYLAIRSF